MNVYTLDLDMEMSVEEVEIPMELSAEEVDLEMEIATPVIIAPIPSNYGLITYDGGVITVS